MFNCTKPFKSHKFAKWTTVHKYQTEIKQDGKVKDKVCILVQERICEDCGFIQSRKEKIYLLDYDLVDGGRI